MHSTQAVGAGPDAGGQAANAAGGILHIGDQSPGPLRRVHVGHLYPGVAQIQVLKDFHLIILPDPYNGCDPSRVGGPHNIRQLFPIYRHMLRVQHKKVKSRQGQQFGNRRIRQLNEGADCALAAPQLVFQSILSHNQTLLS